MQLDNHEDEEDSLKAIYNLSKLFQGEELSREWILNSLQSSTYLSIYSSPKIISLLASFLQESTNNENIQTILSITLSLLRNKLLPASSCHVIINFEIFYSLLLSGDEIIIEISFQIMSILNEQIYHIFTLEEVLFILDIICFVIECSRYPNLVYEALVLCYTIVKHSHHNKESDMESFIKQYQTIIICIFKQLLTDDAFLNIIFEERPGSELVISTSYAPQTTCGMNCILSILEKYIFFQSLHSPMSDDDNISMTADNTTTNNTDNDSSTAHLQHFVSKLATYIALAFLSDGTLCRRLLYPQSTHLHKSTLPSLTSLAPFLSPSHKRSILCILHSILMSSTLHTSTLAPTHKDTDISSTLPLFTIHSLREVCTEVCPPDSTTPLDADIPAYIEHEGYQNTYNEVMKTLYGLCIDGILARSVTDLELASKLLLYCLKHTHTYTNTTHSPSSAAASSSSPGTKQSAHTHISWLTYILTSCGDSYEGSEFESLLELLLLPEVYDWCIYTHIHDDSNITFLPYTYKLLVYCNEIISNICTHEYIPHISHTRTNSNNDSSIMRYHTLLSTILKRWDVSMISSSSLR